MSHNAKTTIAVAVVTLSVLVFSTTLVHALWYAPEEEITVTNAPPPKLPAPTMRALSRGEGPAHLVIPSLDIDANVQEVGVNGRGNMGVPTNFTDVAWYKYGAIPGELGSAVMDGHVDNGLGLDGVFKHLGDIKVGDDVFVETEKGERLHFVVVDVESYSYQGTPDSQIFLQNDAARLNLITCEGKWVKADKTYDTRLVVYTELVRNSSDTSSSELTPYTASSTTY